MRLMWLQQLVQVHHHIFHFGIVHGPLRRATPSLFSAGIIMVHANDIKFVEVCELESLGIADPSAEHQV